MKNQLFQLISIQFKEFWREPGALFWSFAFPVLMAWGLGIAFKGKPETIVKVAVVQNINSSDSSLITFLIKNTKLVTSKKQGNYYEYIIENEKTGRKIIQFIPVSFDSAVIMLKRGNISVIITNENNNFSYHFDPANPDAQLTYIYISSIITGIPIMTDKENIKPLESVGTRYIDFLIPGLLGMGIMSSCLWGVSYSLIEKRSKKLLRRMIATPMKKTNFLLSIVISRIIITFLESAVLILFAYYLFDIKIQGSWAALIMILISGNITFIGLSILISSRTSNTQIGNGLINAVTMPMMMLSGIFFSYYNFPDWAIPVIKQLPLTVFADSLRSVFIEGAGIMTSIIPFAWLSTVGIICFVFGLKIYKWY